MAENQSFGQWLRYKRRELDLTQEAFSREIGCAEVTIRKIEADQLRPSRQMAELLVKKLGIFPEERERYIRFARNGILQAHTLNNLPSNNLPHVLTSFIGREHEVTEVERLLGSSRLLTLTGTGGIGKTRLAQQAAAGSIDRYPDGVWLVELASLADPDLVPRVVAGTLGLQNSGKGSYESILILHLVHKHTLIVLDNCEHVLDACARLALTLLQNCPKVTILTTSREQLRVAGEIPFRVPSLTAYDPKIAANHNELEQTDSVRLFVERAVAILPDFKLTRENLPAVARICHRLDGIPLAIELAAARTNILSIEQIAGFLDDRFRLLTDGSRIALPRHRTLRASIDWSFDLLSEPERLLLQRLSVFSGGWTLEAAEAVCPLDGLEAVEIIDLLNSLEKKSLIVVDTLTGKQARYRMLETIRQYAHEKLTEGEMGGDGLLANLQDRHLAYFLALSLKLGPKLHTAQILETLQLLDLETDNLRSAITWGLSKSKPRGTENVLGILNSLDYFWSIQALYWETFPRYQRAIEQIPNDSEFSSELKAWGYYVFSHLQVDFNIGVETLEYLNQSIRIFRQGGNRIRLAQVLALRCHIIFRQIHFFPPDPAFCEEDAQRDKEECLSIMNELTISPDNETLSIIAWINCWVGAGELFHGAFQESKFFSERSQAHFKQLGDLIGELYGWGVELYARINLNDEVELLSSIDQALNLASRINHKWFQSHFHNMKALVYYRIGEYTEFEENAKRCFVLSQEVGSVREQNNLSIWLGDYYTDRKNYTEALHYLCQALNHLSKEENSRDLYLSLEALSVSAKLAVQTRHFPLAAKLLGFIQFRLEGYSGGFGPINHINQRRLVESLETVRNAMTEDEFQITWYQGQAITMEQAVELALETIERPEGQR